MDILREGGVLKSVRCWIQSGDNEIQGSTEGARRF
ncbi:unnamed protein product [Arabidopsis halleri]